MSGLFSDTKRDPVVQAVIDAQQDERCLQTLFDLLDPVLYRIARRIASQVIDDAVQMAKIRIWKKIQKVDIDRPETIKTYVMKAAVSGMRDEVRKYLRQHPMPMASLENVEIAIITDMEMTVQDYDGVLELYMMYIQQTGDIHGAHKAVGDILEVSTARASTLFHQASRDFIERWKKENA